MHQVKITHEVESFDLLIAALTNASHSFHLPALKPYNPFQKYFPNDKDWIIFLYLALLLTSSAQIFHHSNAVNVL